MGVTYRPGGTGRPRSGDWESAIFQGLSNSFASPQDSEPMGNAIRRLVNATQGARLPLTPFAPQAPGPAEQAPTFENRLDYHKNRWRTMAPTATAFTPGMSYDGRTKLRTPEEYEAYMDQQAAKKAQIEIDRARIS